jgi:hypothetical protein
MHFVGKPEREGWNCRKAGRLCLVDDYSLPNQPVRHSAPGAGSRNDRPGACMQVEVGGMVPGHKIIVRYVPPALGGEVRHLRRGPDCRPSAGQTRCPGIRRHAWTPVAGRSDIRGQREDRRPAWLATKPRLSGVETTAGTEDRRSAAGFDSTVADSFNLAALMRFQIAAWAPGCFCMSGSGGASRDSALFATPAPEKDSGPGS